MLKKLLFLNDEIYISKDPADLLVYKYSHASNPKQFDIALKSTSSKIFQNFFFGEL